MGLMVLDRPALIGLCVALLTAASCAVDRSAGDGAAGDSDPPLATTTVPLEPEVTDAGGATTVPGFRPGATTTIVDAPDPDLDDVFDDCEARRRQARIVFAPQLEMRVGQVHDVTVHATVSGEVSPDDGSTPTTIEELVVRCFVRARLGGSGFRVEPDPTEFQVRSFLDQSTVSWTWGVEPLRDGELRLVLEVQSVVRDRTGAVEQFTTDILVTSRQRTVLQVLDGIATGVVTHPVAQFMGAAGLLATVRYAVRRAKGTPQGPRPPPDVVD